MNTPKKMGLLILKIQKNGFINFENPKNNKYNKNLYLSRNNKNPFKKNSNISNENNYNYNLNSYRNSKYDNNTLTDENKTTTTLSQLNKTLELNNAYKELYNSIDEKNDSDITKYFGNNGTDLNSNLTENHSRLNSKENNHSTDMKNKNGQKEKRSLTPPVYNTFDYLYYEKKLEKNKNYTLKDIILLNQGFLHMPNNLKIKIRNQRRSS